MCWLQAGVAAAGRRRITPADFRPGGDQQLSFAGMNRIGHAGPPPAARAAALPQPSAPAGGTQLQLCGPGESRHFDKAHWAASSITGEALQQARRIAAELAATRGWNTRIITETGRALAVVLADHIPGDMISWSELSPAPSPWPLSTRPGPRPSANFTSATSTSATGGWSSAARAAPSMT